MLFDNDRIRMHSAQMFHVGNDVGLDAASSLSIVHSLKKLTQLGLTSVPWLNTQVSWRLVLENLVALIH